MRARLLDVNVFAGLHAPNRHEGMPMVRGGDGDRVDILVLEQLSYVLVRLRCGFVQACKLLQAVGDVRVVNIADRRNFHILELAIAAEMVLAAAANANASDADLVIGRAKRARRSADCRSRTHQKASSIHCRS